ncbi:MAG: transposase, partial [Anaerolineae bacterium]
MIGYFPAPYPDELFYSLCARYGDRMGYTTRAALLRDLFGVVVMSTPVLLARRLRQFIANLPAGHPYTVEQLIDRHTLLPFFAPFLPRERVERLRRHMADRGHYVKPLDAGIRSQRIRPAKYLMYCPQCVLEDRERFGETYWHRLPQL